MHDEREEARERRARSHSARIAILALLAKDELTASQIRADLPGGPMLGNVNYHLRVLVDTGLVVRDDGCYRLA